MILELFPEPIYKERLHLSEQDVQFVAEFKQTGVSENSYGNFATNRDDVLEDPKLSDLKNLIQKHIDAYVSDIIGSDEVRLVITESWVNYTDNGAAHHTHNHANSIISGVVYFTPNPSSIAFFRDNNYKILQPNVDRFNRYNMFVIDVDVDKGDIILFNSSLPHGVQKNNSKETRISLSFNTFYKGILGKRMTKSYLELK